MHCATQQGLLESALGEHANAAATFAAASSLAGSDEQSELYLQGRLAAGFAALERGGPTPARKSFAQALRASAGEAWWQRENAAVAKLGLASAGSSKKRGQAIDELEATISMFEEAIAITEDSEPRLYLARARALLTEWRGPR